MQTKKGFTLIELLVVIAIIGILSSVVLISLQGARSKGEDTAIRNNLSTVRVQAELYYDSHDYSYDGMDEDPILQEALNAANKFSADSDATVLNIDDTEWLVAVKLKSKDSGFWCIDSMGISEEVDTAPSGMTCREEE